MFKIDTGVYEKSYNAPAFDRWEKAQTPDAEEWRRCSCFALITVWFDKRNGVRHYQQRCPACFDAKVECKSFGFKKARNEFGQWRVENALPRESLRDMPERDRLRLGRSWIWKARYNEYLSSEKWKLKRLQVLNRADGRCERCLAPAQHVHHRHYLALGDEALSDLEALCVPCHEHEHGRAFA